MPNREKTCRALVWGWFALWLLTAGLAIVGTFGLFGVAPDGLSAVYVMALGLPWSILIAKVDQVVPLWVAQSLVFLAPGVTWLILRRICRS